MSAEKPNIATLLPEGCAPERLYVELKAVASAYLARERTDHTLQATALVHEGLVRLARDAARDQGHPGHAAWRDAQEFFRLASVAMQRVLVEYARQKAAARRGGTGAAGSKQGGRVAWGRVALDEVPPLTRTEMLGREQLERLHRALNELEEVDARAVAVVRFRFFGGLTNAEIARAMSVSLSTVESDWRFARAWIGRVVGSGRGG